MLSKTNNSADSQLNSLTKKNSDIVKRTIESYSNKSEPKMVNAEPATSSTPPVAVATPAILSGRIKQKSPPALKSPSPSILPASNARSTLSESLVSRLSFKSTPTAASSTTSATSTGGGNLVIKFNNDSLLSNPQAKVVSSTTEDNDDEEFASSKLKNLKRRIKSVYDSDSQNSDGDNKSTGGKIISLKPKRTASLNDDVRLNRKSVLNSDHKSGNVRKISSNFENFSIEVNTKPSEKKSVFNRIRSATDEPSAVIKFPGEQKAFDKAKRISTSLVQPDIAQNIKSKVISTNFSKTPHWSLASASYFPNSKKPLPKLQMDVASTNAKNLHDRIKFT